MLKRIAIEVAQSLLEIEAVTLSPKDLYTWTSGIKSPIYCDNRLVMSYPKIRSQVADAFATLINMHFPTSEAVAGTATAGIPHAAWVAERLNVPMIYVRDKAKGHGKQNQIEGRLVAGQKVVIIEDLISTGKSSLQAALAVKEAGAEVVGVISIFTYELPKAKQLFEQEGIRYHSITDYTTLVEEALKLGKIASVDLESLHLWREQFK